MPQQVPARIDLKPAQRHALAQLGDGRLKDLTRSAYQELTGMSRSQAAYDLADLVQAGILERLGGGRSTRYRLHQQTATAQRQWTDERIRAELAKFCTGRATWPAASEFKAAGHADLYVAASRYGGIGYWTAELGLRPGRAPEQELLPLRYPRRLSWAAAGASVGALLVGVAVAIVQQWPAGQQKPGTAQGSSPAEIANRATHSRRSTRPRAAKPVVATRPTAVGSRQERPASPAPRAELVVQSVSRHESRPVSEPTIRATTSPKRPSVGPVPLPAPSGSSATPAPLPLP